MSVIYWYVGCLDCWIYFVYLFWFIFVVLVGVSVFICNIFLRVLISVFVIYKCGYFIVVLWFVFCCKCFFIVGVEVNFLYVVVIISVDMFIKFIGWIVVWMGVFVCIYMEYFVI